MREYILSFCNEFEYPDGAAAALVECYDKIAENQSARDIFFENVDNFNQGVFKDKGGELDALEPLKELCNIYTVHLLFLICLSKQLRVLYKQHNIDYGIFYDSVCDLKYKLLECHSLHSVWGVFVAWWLVDYFYLKRFALGRLQFELSTYNDTVFEKNGYTVKNGDTVINMHIPSSGPLKSEDCLKSYIAASEFFKDKFESGVTVFVCDSWLLNPYHKDFLPQNSNILKFQQDFNIVRVGKDESCHDAWRVFNQPFEGNADILPENTSLQRAYKGWLKQGNTFYTGYGVFFFKDNKVI